MSIAYFAKDKMSMVLHSIFCFCWGILQKRAAEAIDTIKKELERRLVLENFLFVRDKDKLLLDSANAKRVNLPEKMKSI